MSRPAFPSTAPRCLSHKRPPTHVSFGLAPLILLVSFFFGMPLALAQALFDTPSRPVPPTGQQDLVEFAEFFLQRLHEGFLHAWPGPRAALLDDDVAALGSGHASVTEPLRSALPTPAGP